MRIKKLTAGFLSVALVLGTIPVGATVVPSEKKAVTKIEVVTAEGKMVEKEGSVSVPYPANAAATGHLISEAFAVTLTGNGASKGFKVKNSGKAVVTSDGKSEILVTQAAPGKAGKAAIKIVSKAKNKKVKFPFTVTFDKDKEWIEAESVENITFDTMTGITNTSEGVTLANKLVATNAWGKTVALTPVAAKDDTIFPIDETCGMFKKDADVKNTADATIRVAEDGTIFFDTNADAKEGEAYAVMLDVGEVIVLCTKAGSADSSVWSISYSKDPIAILATDNAEDDVNPAAFDKLKTEGWTVVSKTDTTLPDTVTKIAEGATLKVMDNALDIDHNLENAGTIIVDTDDAGPDDIADVGAIKNTGTIYVEDGSDLSALGAVEIENNGTITVNGKLSSQMTVKGTEGTWNIGAPAEDAKNILKSVLANEDTAENNKIFLDTSDDDTVDMPGMVIPWNTTMTVEKGTELTTDGWGHPVTIEGTLINNGTCTVVGNDKWTVTGESSRDWEEDRTKTFFPIGSIENNGVFRITDEGDLINRGVITNKGKEASFEYVYMEDKSAFYNQNTNPAEIKLDIGRSASVGYSADKCITFAWDQIYVESLYLYSSEFAPRPDYSADEGVRLTVIGITYNNSWNGWEIDTLYVKSRGE